LRIKKRLYDSPRFLKACVWLSPIGFVAIIAGWFTAETGRQPWVIYGLLRTSEAASHIKLANVLTSFLLIIVVYGIVFGIFYFHYLKKILNAGPQIDTIDQQPFAYLGAAQPQEKN
ncbi:MAG: cytochrome ubiquinol oxidase subunit I, partial [Gammaproteobacteria bacterium]|nr:cytochrome ubiquinol oxidase subunit I [Gammaproteobacteria bacterium]